MDKKLPLALKVNDLDNVATVFSNEAVAGCEVEVRDKKGNGYVMKIHSDIPYGHKVALRDIHVIGQADVDIKKGDYVHVHNLDSKRGRGDWED